MKSERGHGTETEPAKTEPTTPTRTWRGLSVAGYEPSSTCFKRVRLEA
ncbi:MAG TPA: hypothetical protein VJV79_33955 [Polyangiaceae bacterium]|nr:hypothetical protein [Polyangiaceae bacterium]